MSCEGAVGLFKDSESIFQFSVLITKRSDFYPVNIRCPEMDTFQKIVEGSHYFIYTIHIGTRMRQDNLLFQGRKALKTFENDTTIVIKNSNK